MPGRLIALTLAIALAGPVSAQSTTPTAITYQGRLDFEGQPYTGLADYRFQLFESATGSISVGPPVEIAGLQVAGGLFTARPDFGERAFEGERFLQISVRTPAWDGTGTQPPFYTFPDRQPVSPAPYALQTRGLFVDESGRVGIGTDNPSARLDVAGDATVTGKLAVGSEAIPSAALFVNGATTLNGPVTMGSGPADIVTIQSIFEILGIAEFRPDIGALLIAPNTSVHLGTGSSIDSHVTINGDVSIVGDSRAINLGDTTGDTVSIPSRIEFGPLGSPIGTLSSNNSRFRLDTPTVELTGGLRFSDGSTQSSAAPQVFRRVASVDFGLLPANGTGTLTATVPGARPHHAIITGSEAHAGRVPFLEFVSARITANDTVQLVFRNASPIFFDPLPFDYTVIVFP